jgi:flagellar protein FlaG
VPEISGYGGLNSASVALAQRAGQGENRVASRILQSDRLKVGDGLQESKISPTQEGSRSLKANSSASVSDGSRSVPVGEPNSFGTREGLASLKRSTPNLMGPGGFAGPSRLDRNAFASSELNFGINRAGAIQAPPEDKEPIDNFQTENNLSINQFAERVDRSIDTLNKRMEDLNRAVRFSRDKESNTDVITVVNPDNGDIVRQIPPEHAIRVSEGLKSMRGMLFDDKA